MEAFRLHPPESIGTLRELLDQDAPINACLSMDDQFDDNSKNGMLLPPLPGRMTERPDFPLPVLSHVQHMISQNPGR
jgi:hypothetical protein